MNPDPDSAVFSMVIGLGNYGNGGKYLYCDESVFAHELGHVLSLDHEKSALALDDDLRSFVYAIGYYTGDTDIDPDTDWDAFIEDRGVVA